MNEGLESIHLAVRRLELSDKNVTHKTIIRVFGALQMACCLMSIAANFIIDDILEQQVKMLEFGFCKRLCLDFSKIIRTTLIMRYLTLDLTLGLGSLV